MPRRYYNYLPQFQQLHQISTLGSWILGAGLFLTAAYLLATFRKPMDAPMNPWGGRTLEWEAQSPPITHNFDFDPVLKHGPYDFRPERPRLDEPVHHG
jgi:cytochrome c oxidase subunit 1